MERCDRHLCRFANTSTTGMHRSKLWVPDAVDEVAIEVPAVDQVQVAGRGGLAVEEHGTVDVYRLVPGRRADGGSSCRIQDPGVGVRPASAYTHILQFSLPTPTPRISPCLHPHTTSVLRDGRIAWSQCKNENHSKSIGAINATRSE